MELQKQCKQCQAEFAVADDDLAFYKKISPTFSGKTFEIPPPTMCPDCRQQHRIAFRNERNLYKRKCDLTGREIVSMYRENTPFPVYFASEWYSDKWDPKKYAREYDFSKTFFEQFANLLNSVPRQSAYLEPATDINSEYTNSCGHSKNCYLIFESETNENCYYSRTVVRCRDCCDCSRAFNCESCYECIDVTQCYNCDFCQNCDNCSDCFFSTSLKGCKHCFGCHGLTQKDYYLFNKAVSKKEWENFFENLDLTPEGIEKYIKESNQIRLKVPHRFAQVIKCQNSTGNYLYNCKNAKHCFDGNDLEDCSYCFDINIGGKDCFDFSSFGSRTQLIYNSHGCGHGTYNLISCSDCYENVSDLMYCESCTHGTNHCFGCAGLRKSQYCIFNKQYTREEYEKLVPKIIEKMMATPLRPPFAKATEVAQQGYAGQEWGEFFPFNLSPFGYNETLAMERYPIDKKQALKIGAKWEKIEPPLPQADSIYEPAADIDNYINSKEEREKLLSGVLKCQASGKLYKLIPQELGFYMKKRLPIPRKHHDVRYQRRFNLKNPRKLYQRRCMNEGCQNEFETTYSPDRPEKVYCESCYQKSII